MRQVLTVTLLVATVGLVGCDNNKKQSPATSEPAPAMESAPASAYPEPMPATPAATAAPAGPTAGGTYVVQKGDTLWKIATKTYGDGQKWKEIQDANPGLTPQKLKVGQTIKLP